MGADDAQHITRCKQARARSTETVAGRSAGRERKEDGQTMTLL